MRTYKVRALADSGVRVAKRLNKLSQVALSGQ